MPSVSKIPQNINKYAIKCAHEIKNKEVEFAKGINFEHGKITSKSELVEGLRSTVSYDFAQSPKDVFVHNHPIFTNTIKELSHDDIATALKNGVQKIIAATKYGFTAIDFSTASKKISKEQMYEWIRLRQALFQVKKMELGENKLLGDLAPKMLEKIHYQTLKDFAKYSGATFSDVKWADYKKVKR